MALSKRLTNIIKNADDLHIKKIAQKEIANRATATQAMKATEKNINKSINKAVGLEYEARKLSDTGRKYKKRESELTKVFNSKEARAIERKAIRQNNVEGAARRSAENLKEKMQPLREKQVYDKGALKLEYRQKQLKEFDAKNSAATGNSSAKKKKDPKADNWVYKAAAAGVGGGLVLSMSNSRGQQSNQQLYGQGGY